MLLDAAPELLRKGVVVGRTLSTVAILFKFFTVFQPGGGAERTALLKQVTDMRPGTTIQEVLNTIRQWRRWISGSRGSGASLILMNLWVFIDVVEHQMYGNAPWTY